MNLPPANLDEISTMRPNDDLSIDQRMLAQSIARWAGPLPSASMLAKYWSPTWSLEEVQRMLSTLAESQAIEVVNGAHARQFRISTKS